MVRPSSCRSTTRSSPRPRRCNQGGRRPASDFVEIRFPQRRHPDLPAWRTRTSPHPQRSAARTARFHPHVRGYAGVHRPLRDARGQGLLDSLPPPFFRALTHYAADGSYSWHCPGHSGGVAFPQEPGGADVPPVLRREHAARRRLQRGRRTRPAARPYRAGGTPPSATPARIFNADHLFFVTNGTSTSNKIVWHSTVAPGDTWWSTATATSPSSTRSS